MQKKPYIVVLATFVFAVCGLAVYKYFAIMAAIEMGKASAPPPPTVEAVKVISVNWPRELNAPARITSGSVSEIKSEVTAILQQIAIAAGRPVKKGDVILKLDDREQQEKLAAVEQSLVRARAAFERAGNLRQSKAVSDDAYDLAKEQLAIANANVNTENLLLAKYTIKASEDGVVGQSPYRVGDLVASGDVVLNFTTSSALEVDFSLPQDSGVQAGDQVKLLTTEGQELIADVIRIDSAVNLQTGQVAITAKPRMSSAAPDLQKSDRIMVGQFLQAHYQQRVSDKLFALPETAIVYAPWGASIYLVEQQQDKPATVKQIAVDVIRTKDQLVGFAIKDTKVSEQLASSPVDQSPLAVAVGGFKLRDGQEIKLS